jgi:hypothetical protein
MTKAKTKKEGRSLLVHRVPEVLFHEFKAACASKGRTMREVVMEKMKEFAYQT